jgi:hypothetical protein
MERRKWVADCDFTLERLEELDERGEGEAIR